MSFALVKNLAFPGQGRTPQQQQQVHGEGPAAAAAFQARHPSFDFEKGGRGSGNTAPFQKFPS